MTLRSDLTTEVEKALRDEAYDGGFGALTPEGLTAYVRRLAEAAVEVVEEAHTRTDDESTAEAERIWPINREYSPQQTRAVFSVREVDAYCVSAFKRGAQWAVGFRRSVVPEPSAEDEFAPGECTGAGDCDAPVHIHGCYRRHSADQCDAPNEYGHLTPEPQSEPSDAQVRETIRQAMREAGEGEVYSDLMAGIIMRALRAAVSEQGENR